MSPPIGVADYYAGKSIFITGATGFMGIVLVEKLLRSCPDVKTLYLLMRTKKGLSVQERLQKYINDEVFDRIKAENPKNLQKLRVVPGDVVDDNLGMTIADREELQRECQIVFHVAASVRFDMFIRDAVEINVFGTKKVLELAESMKNLEVFLHMSTSYCHDYLDVLEEKLYPAMHSPQDVMRIVKWMNDDILKAIEKKLIHPLPNTYTYTKNISEGLVAQYARKFKIAIARPSIVAGAVQEPFPGWINAMSGPTGLLVAGYKGVFRVMHTKKDMQPDVIAVDMAVNASILLAYTTVVEQHEEIQVSNITNAGVNTKSWVDFAAVGWQVMRKYPSSICIWYPDISSTESRALYQVSAIFMHWIPALLIDMLLAIFRQKTFMIRIQKRLHHGLELLNHYMNGEWVFKNDNFRSLRNRIPAAERKVFYTEYEKIDLDQYMVNYLRGIRQYCCRESWDSLPKSRRQQKFLYGLRITVRLILLWWFLKMVYSYVAFKA